MNRFVVGAFWTLYGIAMVSDAKDPECVRTKNRWDYTYRKDTSAFADPLYMWNCEGNMPIRRTQGFRRPKVCIPGQQPGTCIIPLFDEPKTLAKAAEMCLLEYGGRLAVAHDEESTTQWIQTIWRNADYSSAKTKRFWIGALVDSSAKGGNFFSVTDYRAFRFLPEEQWNACFMNEARLPRNLWPLANRLPRRAFQNAKSCPTWGVVLDVSPSDGRWHVEDASVKHGFLCEAPRWPKLDCGPGWSLIPQLKLCLKPLSVTVWRTMCYEHCSNLGGMEAGNNAEYRWYYIEVTEPIYSKPGSEYSCFYMGMHGHHNADNGRYLVDNLDGSAASYEKLAPINNLVTTPAYCDYNGYVIAIKDYEEHIMCGCMCQKVVDISGVDGRRSFW